MAKGWLGDDIVGLRPSLCTDGFAKRETNKLILSAGRTLVENLRHEGVGKPLGLGTIIVSLPLLVHHIKRH